MENIKQLEEELINVEGKEKVIVLNKLVKKTYVTKPVISLEYAESALKLSIDINYKKGEADTLNNIGIIYYYLKKI